MARLDDLVSQIADQTLRRELEAALATLKQRQRFGLVFEEHIPETTALLGLPVQAGSLVQRRTDPTAKHTYRVVAITAEGEATIEPIEGGSQETASACDLLVIKRFGEPIYPALTPLGAVRRGPTDKPHHAIINGENFHTLQLLTYLYEGQVDCVYIDPPYNTGAKDWKYNNDYVDKSDAWKHSKWLSMMEKRLRLAKRLLKPQGILIVTVDENEVNHLGILLEQLFVDALRQMVTICINPSGASGDGLSRVDEYAFFCFFGGSMPVRTPDDMLSRIVESDGPKIEWESLLRRGNAWYRKSRRNLCYPVLIDPETKQIVGTGERFGGNGDEGEDGEENEENRPRTINGFPVAWPVRKDGKLGIWRVDAARLKLLAQQGYAFVSSYDDDRGTWTIKYLMEGTIDAIESGEIEIIGRGEQGQVLLRPTVARDTIAKTMWHRGRHTAGGSGGTQMLTSLLGRGDLFPFPKSVYSVRDCLAVAVGDRKDALIVDFFAGSGTTFQATCLLNAQDQGQRRCVLVTNNEVNEKQTEALHEEKFFQGDPEFDACGIFEQVTRPRCEAVVTGRRPDGTPAPRAYLDGRPIADGFLENVEFYRLEYLDPDDVDLGRQFDAIVPALWLAAGGVGCRETRCLAQGFSLPEGSTYGVLFKESRFRQFKDAFAQRPDVTHVWLVTDSEDAFSEMRSALSPGLSVSMLYRDYLRNFRINLERTV